MISFNDTKKFFDKYIEEKFLIIKNNFLDISSDENMKKFSKRNEMIRQKYTHTIRVVENIAKMAQKMGQSINFLELTKVVGLLHDVGRFEQAMYSDTYVDSIVYKSHPYITNHGEEGAIFLCDQGFEKFNIPKLYQPALKESVGLHQVNELPKHFNFKVDLNFGKINPEKVLTGTYNFNDFENKIISLLLQMIRDIDKIDILYQRANGEIGSVPYIIEVNNIGKDNILKIWGITFEDLKELNSLDEIDHARKLKISVEKIPVEKLFVNSDIKEMMYQGKRINLKDLQRRDDYSFITAIWWSIYTFLSDINFVSNLELIKENELLDQIYEKYPLKYRPLIDEIFNFAKTILIEEQLFNNKDNLYINKSR